MGDYWNGAATTMIESVRPASVFIIDDVSVRVACTGRAGAAHMRMAGVHVLVRVFKLHGSECGHSRVATKAEITILRRRPQAIAVAFCDSFNCP